MTRSSSSGTARGAHGATSSTARSCSTSSPGPARRPAGLGKGVGEQTFEHVLYSHGFRFCAAGSLRGVAKASALTCRA
eukprot:1297124-Pyramimonas_sp.AAC.1